jgi:hypothetical protein
MSPCSVGGAGSVLCTGDVIRVHASYNKPDSSPPIGPIADAMGILSLALPANPPDADGDGTWDGCDTSDSDGDQFSDRIEGTAGTLANDPCGANAWPPDINSNGSVGVIDDIAAVAGDVFKSVPPAPARHDIAPDPPNGTIGVIDDLARIAGLAFGSC